MALEAVLLSVKALEPIDSIGGVEGPTSDPVDGPAEGGNGVVMSVRLFPRRRGTVVNALLSLSLSGVFELVDGKSTGQR